MPYEITAESTQNKERLLRYFRQRGEERLASLREEVGNANFKELAGAINGAVRESFDSFKEVIIRESQTQGWSLNDRLRSLLILTYSAQVAMLDLRNQVWPYDYMAFSRRIGELWEQFVHIPFSYPISDLTLFIPPLFSEVRSNLRKELEDYIRQLPLEKKAKNELLEYYDKVWILVDSGEISLQLDLHAIILGRRVNIDFKSGFGSNEKGNTNRLLMVATIYRNLKEEYKNILLVRAKEDKNNHYFRTLKNSGVWEAYCGLDAYRKIGEYTGFDIRTWITSNIDWRQDLLPETFLHLRNNKLTGYLEW